MKTLRPALIVAFCALAVLLLPVTILCAIWASLGGDQTLLKALRGKIPV